MNDPSAWVNKTPDKYDVTRHKRERAENGFSVFDWWNFCDYIAWVNIQALEKFKEGSGYPGDLNDMDEWRRELDIMINGFKAHLKLQNLEYDWKDKTATNLLVETKDAGLALYAQRFSTLWD